MRHADGWARVEWTHISVYGHRIIKGDLFFERFYLPPE